MNPVLLIGGVVLAAVVVLSGLFFVLVRRRSEPQQTVEAKRITVVPILRCAGLARDDSSGDIICVTLQFASGFLQKMNGGRNRIEIRPADFSLLTDAEEQKCIMISGTNWAAETMDVPIKFRGPNDIVAGLAVESSHRNDLHHLKSEWRRSSGRRLVRKADDASSCLPTLGECRIESETEFETLREVSDYQYDGRGTIRATVVSGAATGQLTLVTSIHSTGGRSPSIVQQLQSVREKVRPFDLSGTLEAKLEDGADVRFEYYSDKCRVSWSGNWKGVRLHRAEYGDAQTMELEGGAMGDKMVSVQCMFECPRTGSRLALRYKDGPPLDLDLSLTGPAPAEEKLPPE